MSDQKPHKDKIEALLNSKKRHDQNLSPKSLFEKIKQGDKLALAEAITLLESTNPSYQKRGQEILKMALPLSGKSIRIGITGVPGVGKSTFIESFGLALINSGHKVAVLAIDPSSEKSGGSILGDKTRMVELSSHPQAFIRPSASGHTLGGVSRRTRESIFLCEAAGFDRILIETVGVGQSEIAVHSMSDFFMLLMLAGAGDELQGIKRGIMEMADGMLINKADGDNVKAANLARTQYKSALHLFPPNENNWIPRVETISALEKNGLTKAVEMIEDFYEITFKNGHFNQKRREQQLYWMNETVREMLSSHFIQKPGVKDLIESMKKEIAAGKMTSFQASEIIFEKYLND